MLYLGIDSTAITASVAIADENLKIYSESYINAGLTHSETLMSLIDSTLKNSGHNICDIDRLCVNYGPGSFTGIRIGIAAVKGLSFANDIPCAGISTLDSMAYSLYGCGLEGIICCSMDARCSQVYAALFSISGNIIQRLTEDVAISIEELYNILKESYEDKMIYFVGDGSEICFNSFGPRLSNTVLLGHRVRFQSAVGTVYSAILNNAVFDLPDKLEPVYLRLPQAERELKLRKGDKL